MAENNVDSIVKQQFFANCNTGVFVDVGAAGPDYLSISRSFRAYGWTVYAIEPNPHFCSLYRARGYEILQYACGPEDRDDVDFVIVNSHGAPYGDGHVSYESFSSLRIKDEYRKLKPELDETTIKVSMRKLDTILALHAPDLRQIDILAIDVEGWELEVLTGFSVHSFRPKVMIIENIFREEKYRSTLLALNYRLWQCFGPNDIYVSEAFADRSKIFD